MNREEAIARLITALLIAGWSAACFIAGVLYQRGKR